MFEMMETAQGSPLLRVAAKCKAVEPSKSTQGTSETSRYEHTVNMTLEQLVATNVSHNLVCMCIQCLYCFYQIYWKVSGLFGWPVNFCLMSSVYWPSSIIARASNKTLVAKPSRTKCKGVRPWRSPHCATVKYCYIIF